MNALIRPVLVMFAALTVICGVLYPLATTGIGKLAFPGEVAGSIVERDGKPVGSLLIGQSFTSPKYFWGRPSATSPMANNGAGSGGSNQGPTNPALVDAVKARIAALKEADPANTRAVPVDLVTASGSGLDPEISLAGALYQAPRIARVRGVPLAQVENLIAKLQKAAYIGFFGEARVNVLELNLALDAMQK
ncbi:potassium-transporting ATPase subunit KdpC [Janthinobacterium aquaticum]|uniref:potassium-transporting ATPase subunit KdpC n=1 Tax=Janthinobacterium sp. FT58W TaxID=2654254 RepID=UPI001265373B|nr:potassium-transporting ATPase subunit KdpC [Janthinobacterium sp. FT58W]KAB8043718.1 potassium-transporting ATPase subunit KdpC [Janthinobacterium sp. FT58W]